MIIFTLLGSVGKFIVAHWKIAAVALLVAILFFAGFHVGAARVQARWDAANKAISAAVAKVETKQTAVSTKVETKVVTKLQVIHDKGAAITKEVVKYVPLSVPDLPYGFRLLHDAAAAGVPLPDATGVLNGPSVPAATVAATVSDNYAGCRADAEVIEGWQKWATHQADASK